MDDLSHLCGCVLDERATDAVCLALAGQGKEPLFKDARPELRGFGEGKSVLLQEAEAKLFGHNLPSFNQSRGTCTEQGSTRALQDSLYYSLAFGDRVGSAVELAGESLYGIARVTIGKGQFGRASPWGTNPRQVRGDGCAGCMVAQAAHDFGLLKRGVYDSIDLSKPREDLAIQWGNVGTPQSLMAESASYKAAACFRATSLDDLRDGLAAGYAAAICGQLCAQGQRDSDGMAPLQACGGHCMETCGVFIDIHGDLIFVVQNSWGANGPQGGRTFKLQDGREVQPREGCCGVRPEQMQRGYFAGNGCEVWLLAPPATPWQTAETTPDNPVGGAV